MNEKDDFQNSISERNNGQKKKKKTEVDQTCATYMYNQGMSCYYSC